MMETCIWKMNPLDYRKREGVQTLGFHDALGARDYNSF